MPRRHERHHPLPRPPRSSFQNRTAGGQAHRAEGGARLFVATQNLVEFWAVATRPASANGLGLTVQQAHEELDQIQSLFSVLHETPESYPIWRDLVARVGVSGRQAHDARLAAVMIANNVTHILTFNRDDFLRYPELTVIDPAAMSTVPDM